MVVENSEANVASIIVSGARWNYKRIRSLRRFVSCECINCNGKCEYVGETEDGSQFECPVCSCVYTEPTIEVYWQMKRKA